MDEIELEFDWEMPLAVLAGIFAGMGWEYDIESEGLKSPSADVLQALTEGLISRLAESDDYSYITLGRLLCYRDHEFPDSFDIYVKVGHCSPVIPVGVS